MPMLTAMSAVMANQSRVRAARRAALVTPRRLVGDAGDDGGQDQRHHERAQQRDERVADRGEGAGPPVYSEDPNSELASQARQVHEASLSLSDEQRDTAEFWAGAPAVRWMTVAADLVQQAPDLELTAATEALALTGIALADGTIVAWAGKYEHLVVRPVTYIQRHIDPTWTPLLPTPGHPEFPAGHSASSTAAATVLEGLLAPDAVTVRDVTDQQPQRDFDSIAEAAAEVSASRVFAGVHYPLGLEAGAEQGRRVGQRVLDLAGPGAA